jgi:hypothetical protein
MIGQQGTARLSKPGRPPCSCFPQPRGKEVGTHNTHKNNLPTPVTVTGNLFLIHSTWHIRRLAAGKALRCSRPTTGDATQMKNKAIPIPCSACYLAASLLLSSCAPSPATRQPNLHQQNQPSQSPPCRLALLLQTVWDAQSPWTALPSGLSHWPLPTPRSCSPSEQDSRL